MQIIQTKATLKNGQIVLDTPPEDLPTDQDVDVIIIVNNNTSPEEYDQARQDMQEAFKQAGIETREQILELIHEVKLELLKERNQC